jgi:hypothetical protein
LYGLNGLNGYYHKNIDALIVEEEGGEEEGNFCFLIISGVDIIGKWSLVERFF